MEELDEQWQDWSVGLYKSLHPSHFAFKSEDSENQKICRICRNSHGNVKKIPCNCTGTMGYVHDSCLRQWIQHQRKNVCEICKEKFYSKYGHKRTFRILVRTLFKRHYFTLILARLLAIVCLLPLMHCNVATILSIADADIERNRCLQSCLPTLVTLKSFFLYECLRWIGRTFGDVGFLIGNWWDYSWVNEVEQDEEDEEEEDEMSEEEFNEMEVVENLVNF